MDVDEAGRDHQVGGVDDALGIVGKLRRDRDDAVAGNRNVGLEGGRARAVHHRAVLDEQRPSHERSSRQMPPGRGPQSASEKCACTTRQSPPSLWKTMVERETNLSP